MRPIFRKPALVTVVLAALGFGLVPATANAAPRIPARLAAADACEGGHEFHWHWTDDPIWWDQTVAESTITITRCWDGNGNLTNGTKATIESHITGGITFVSYQVVDGAFQVTESAPDGHHIKGYLNNTLERCSSVGCNVRGKVKATVYVDARGVMEVNSDPPPIDQWESDPSFTADNPDLHGHDYVQYVPPPSWG